MLNLSALEVKIVQAWSEKGQSSPFPHEMALLKRLKSNLSHKSMSFSARDLQIIMHWAERDTKGYYAIGERFLLEQEAELIAKIEYFLSTTI
jgi:hypothetical protein